MPALVAVAAALSGSACAEDIAQEAMLAAYRRWDVVSGFEAPAAGHATATTAAATTSAPVIEPAVRPRRIRCRRLSMVAVSTAALALARASAAAARVGMVGGANAT